MKYQIGKAAWFLCDIGVNFHGFGTIEKDGTKLFDYYKVDKVTQEQKDKILAWCKDAHLLNASMEYAPELTSLMVAFPKAAYYRGFK